MNERIRALLSQRDDKLRAARALLDTAAAANRDLTDDEGQQHAALLADIKGINGQLDREREMQDLERQALAAGGAGLIVQPGASITGGAPRLEDDPKRGFKSFGELLRAVREGSRPGGVVDQRLLIGAAPTSYGNESAGADGGYLVPPEYGNRLYSLSLEQDALLPLTDGDSVTGNGMTFPADETTPWGSNGIRAYWEGDGEQATQTKLVTKLKELRLRKLFALVPMTEELLADSAAAGSYVERKMAESIRWKTNDAIVNGTGAGTPLGITVAASTVSQAKETGQTAATINATNIAKMFGRCINLSHWLVNPDAYSQLILMTLGDQPIWTPPAQGMQDAPNGLLMGRPVIMSDACATLGTVNDVIGCNFAGYKSITKSGGVEMAQSMHLWFDYAIMAYRAIFRVDGQPWLSAAVSPNKGSVTRSHFVTLATRA